ncbi:uncharacterized protein BDFB_004257 [Asbolus verrucosus]|uniref:Uncharacterized protein n=1 Tax=Asbolus verrucosus TaxID=1661398 RepID=A0A482VX49_ASBVE|nr:uncharacterized protein BDFB_004257 [Asbolus verrucosus]
MESRAGEGHVAGMLDRDQRTAKTCIFDRHVVSVRDYEHSPEKSVLTERNKTISHRTVPGRTSPHSSCKTRKNGHFWKSLHRLKHALIVGACLSLVTFPGALSAPTTAKPMAASRDADPKWLNPCGMGGGVNGAANHRIPDDQLLAQIIDQTRIAQGQETNFQKEFVEKTWGKKFLDHHEAYKNTDWDWLPTKKLPKKLTEHVPQEHLESLELKQTLLDVYSYLQQIAVGLEQVIWDEEDRDGDFKSSFEGSRDHLCHILCELQMAIIENNLPVPNSVTRETMGEEYRNMTTNTNINVRNWIIYRDYLNMLEYIIEK